MSATWCKWMKNQPGPQLAPVSFKAEYKNIVCAVSVVSDNGIMQIGNLFNQRQAKAMSFFIGGIGCPVKRREYHGFFFLRK